ncbi:MAG TPA: S-formylglutathione hydrolase, partial [Steroidobacteraceae bacterium]|nr:S-formylglutathione hydrolase [Steroidobacteraceae bacterium]
MTLLATISKHQCHGGVLGYYQHPSSVTAGDMKFAVFVPPQAANGPVPVLYYLAGLTCTEETFVTKAGALEHAAKHGLMLVAPDTSPRVQLPGDRESWDFGIAAGFYLTATEAPWAKHYRMDRYVTEELPALIAANFPADVKRSGIFGHSMGGHGALTIGLKNPDKYKSLSAFAPIAAPIQSPWGVKAFTGYLGAFRGAWSQYDATELVKAGKRFASGILVDQGTADKFLAEQLKP